MPLLTDRVVLISGGTSGLGAAIARAAAREGALVAMAVRYWMGMRDLVCSVSGVCHQSR